MRSLLAALFLAVVCASLHAQTMNQQAAIPFAFRVGERILPAGEYNISHSNGVLFIREASGDHSVIVITNSAHLSDRSPNSRLSFHRYGENYFLANVWTQGSSDGCELPKSRTEKEFARSIGLPQSVGVALARQ
jgi:hypothetical protein